MKYSIILPVRNGGEYVKECVNSILTQSLNSFNLLILDNCSTDGTFEWIISLNDARIKIYPAAKSLSIEENWDRIKSLPKNEFITLIGHDDILDKHYLEVMDRLISKHPKAQQNSACIALSRTSLPMMTFSVPDMQGNFLQQQQSVHFDFCQSFPNVLFGILMIY